MIRTLNDSNFYAKYYFLKGLHCPKAMSMEYQILCCYPTRDHFSGVHLQYTPSSEIPQAALEVNNEEHGHF